MPVATNLVAGPLRCHRAASGGVPCSCIAILHADCMHSAAGTSQCVNIHILNGVATQHVAEGYRAASEFM